MGGGGGGVLQGILDAGVLPNRDPILSFSVPIFRPGH